MAAKLLHVVAATCLLFVVHSQGRVDLAALRHEDIWPPESSVTGTGLTVDLGYGLYQGYNNATSGLNIWKGIRFAAPPTGDLRWQAPRVPKTNRTLVEATSFGSICVQTGRPGVPPSPDESEDCLLINVYAPPTAKNEKLPMMVWTHGGAFKIGDGRRDLSEFILSSNKSIVGVTIQYRLTYALKLGALGFLSSQEVDAKGAINSGLLDQVFALSWVRKYIGLFGGDKDQVTLAGTSAGGGSVLYHILADEGVTKPGFFRYAFVSSPAVSPQYSFDDAIATRFYQALVSGTGCGNATAAFDCLVRADVRTVQDASVKISSASLQGALSFIPVTDGVYIKELPAIQMAKKRVNGKRLFVGSNAIEGVALPLNGAVTSKPALNAFIQTLFPRLSAANVSSLMDMYQPHYNLTTTFETDGISGATANDVSGIAVGYEQTASNFIGEVLIVCPSYWMSSAFTAPGTAAYHYQYSVPLAGHTEDTYAYLGPYKANQGPELAAAFAGMLANFVRSGDPSISSALANGPSAEDPLANNPASRWPVWREERPVQINMNTTGGTPIRFTHSWGTGIEFVGPGLRNRFTEVDAMAWEGGRGNRCEFLRQLAPLLRP